MIYDLQKASMLKRISAGLLDFLTVIVIATGFFFLLSAIFNYDGILEEYDARYEVLVEEVKLEYNIDYNSISKMTQEEYDEFYNRLKEENRLKDLEDAEKYMVNDEKLNLIFENIFTFTLLVVTFGIMLAYLLFELVIPLFLKNGQTIGKKVFGICLMMENGVKVKPIPLLIRTLLGKYTVETMILVYCFVMVFLFRVVNGFSVLLFGLTAIIMISQLILLIVSKKNLMIHDAMAYTVVVDKESQMIFNNEEELIKYKQEVADKNAKSKRTF